VLLAYGRFGTRSIRPQSDQEIQRILLVRPDHLGDLLFATPTLKRIRQAFPGAHITGLVGPWGRAMWEGNPDLNSLETLPFPGIAGVRRESGIGNRESADRNPTPDSRLPIPDSCHTQCDQPPYPTC
jgi:hypothetical protein